MAARTLRMTVLMFLAAGAIASAALLVASIIRPPRLRYVSSSTWDVTASDGCLSVSWARTAGPPDTGMEFTLAPYDPVRNHWDAFRQVGLSRFDVALSRGMRFTPYDRWAIFPLWVPTLVLGAWPCIAAVNRWRSRRNRQPGFEVTPTPDNVHAQA
jgi:hypothetical protein